MARPSPAPVVDALLAALMADQGNPVESVSSASQFDFDPTLSAASVDQLLARGRIVRLACGHFKMTKALGRTGCPRCGEMIRAGWDHDGFRRLGNADTFSWPDDPLRLLHERQNGEHSGHFDPTNPR